VICLSILTVRECVCVCVCVCLMDRDGARECERDGG